VLHDVTTSPRTVLPRLIARLKVMAEMNIAEHQRPQDGRIRLTAAGKPYDLRIATLPTVHGEQVVMRVLDSGSALLKLEELGFPSEAYEAYQEVFIRPYGAILVTGPTGSGKSTTLYSTLGQIASRERAIITAEDPVEYRLAGINQIQVNTKQGLTFASALRSILRSDPDVILVGEIRDRETAQVAIEAALTGHLVLTTLHTNDAPSSLPRLIEMGVQSYLVASAVEAVVAQRLVRKLFRKCRQAYRPEPTELAEAGFPEGIEVEELFRAKGCSACGGTGFRGRMGVYEVMRVSETIERLTVERASSEEIRAVAIREGMIPMRDCGLERVVEGMTSIRELLRVVS